MKPTVDQKNLAEDFLPYITGLANTDTDEARHDAMTMNRAMLAGVDPYLVMTLCPIEFGNLCDTLGLILNDGTEAIMRAHQAGPASLLDTFGGIPMGANLEFMRGAFWSNLAWRQEALWLLLADCTSEQVEGDDSLTPIGRMIQTVSATHAFIRMVENMTRIDVIDEVLSIIRRMNQELVYVDMGDKTIPNVPVVRNECGFYSLAKQEIWVAGVQAARPGAATHYGVAPGHGTLADHGIICDKYITPMFGRVSGKKES